MVLYQWFYTERIKFSNFFSNGYAIVALDSISKLSSARNWFKTRECDYIKFE